MPSLKYKDNNGNEATVPASLHNSVISEIKKVNDASDNYSPGYGDSWLEMVKALGKIYLKLKHVRGAFKNWVEQNPDVKITYTPALRYAKMGIEDDPEAALLKSNAKTRDAVRESRERKRQVKEAETQAVRQAKDIISRLKIDIKKIKADVDALDKILNH